MEVVQFVSQLGNALWTLKGMYDQHVENGNEINELQSFIQDYNQQIPILRERFQEGGGNVMGIAAFKNLEKDVTEATNKLERWSRNKSFFRLFNSGERMQKLEKLHCKVMASVQKSLGIANLSMLLDLQVTQATILESNAELKSLLITTIGSMHGTLSTEVRDKVVEASASAFADPKFWEDVLAAVDNHNVGISMLKENNIYEDPITTKLMIDPVVASDGNTYCRWTIIDNNWTTNPFKVDEDLTIVIDNLTFRRGLFEKFPEQVQIFRQRRDEYRSHAFSLKAQGLLGDAVLALHYVLQWDKHDVECVEALKQVQGALHEAKEKYLQPSVGVSNESGNGGPSDSSMHEMVVRTRIELHEAYKLFPSLSSSILEVQQRAAYGIYQWSERDVKFQSYIVHKGGIPLLAALLSSSDQITQEHVVSILLDVSRSSHKRRTMFETLEPIAEVLKKGSTTAREQAARIFFNLSANSNRRSVIGNSRVMLALVTSLGDGTLKFQQIATETLNNLFPDALESIVKVLKEDSTIACEAAARQLFNFSMSPNRRDIIGNSGAMLALVTSLDNGTPQFQQIATDTLNILFPDSLEPIAEVLKKGSTKAREAAARILLSLSMSPDRKSVIGNSRATHTLVTSFGEGTLQFQKIASDTLNNLIPDSLEPIAEVLKEGSTEGCEAVARILLNLSTSPDKRSVIGNSGAMHVLVTLLGDGTPQFQEIAIDIVNNLFPDSLEPIAEVLKKFSGRTREAAARILLNLSMSPGRKKVIGNSRAIRALVKPLGEETLQFQKIAIDTLNNLFPDSLEPIAEVLKEGSTEGCEAVARILLNLSTSPDKRSVIGNSGAMHVLVTLLGDGTPQFQEIAIDIVNNLFPDSLEPIAEVLKEGSAKACEVAARLLFNFSMSLERRSIIGNSGAMHALVTLLGDGTPQFQEIAIDIVNKLFPDSLDPIAKVLKEGSAKACEVAARLLFNFSTSLERRSVIGNSRAMCALVTLLGNGTLQVQQIVASTLNNLCHEILNEMQAIEVGMVPILVKLITKQPTSMLEEALSLVDKLLNFWNRSKACHAIRIEAPPTTWLEIMASESPLNQERAASIFYTLCYGDQQYSQQARECQALERIQQFTLSNRTRYNVLELLNSNVSNRNYPTLPVIPFPKKDWWSPSII